MGLEKKSKKESLKLRLENINGGYSLGLAKYCESIGNYNRRSVMNSVIENENEDAVIEIERLDAEWKEEIEFEKQEKIKKNKDIQDLKEIIENIKNDEDLKPYQRKLYALLIGEMVTK